MGEWISGFTRSAAITSTCFLCLWSAPNSATAQAEVEGQFLDRPGNVAPTPRPDSVAPSNIALPADTAIYFRRIFHLFLSAPLPIAIFRQGGIPPIIPTLEVDRNPFGHLGSFQPGGPTRTAQCLLSVFGHEWPSVRHMPSAPERHERQPP